MFGSKAFATKYHDATFPAKLIKNIGPRFSIWTQAVLSCVEVDEEFIGLNAPKIESRITIDEDNYVNR
jgi:hypothetical protein